MLDRRLLQAIDDELNTVAGEWLSSFGSLSAAALCYAIRNELQGDPKDGYPPALEICEALITQEAAPELSPDWVQRTRDIARKAKEYILTQQAQKE